MSQNNCNVSVVKSSAGWGVSPISDVLLKVASKASLFSAGREGKGWEDCSCSSSGQLWWLKKGRRRGRREEGKEGFQKKASHSTEGCTTDHFINILIKSINRLFPCLN